ncbi:DUF6059 family protein [Kitasatospora sp. NPDC101183]|uniref:DUF6059 family protein n=1 Tax=Kitasatospora sp. NPDC101183 TaxID=3364100 RepID=UPI003812E883
MTAAGVLRRIGGAVIEAGLLWVYVPPLEFLPPCLPPRPGRADGLLGPPPRHPERLRPDVPLSRQEKRLQRQLLETGR